MDNAYKLMAFPFVQMMMMMTVRTMIGNILLKKADKRVARLLTVDGTFRNDDDTDDDDDGDWIFCWRTLTNVWCRCWRSRRPPLLSQLPDWTEASHKVGISNILLIVAIVVLINNDVGDGEEGCDDEKPKFFSSFWLFWRLMHLHIFPKCDYGIGWRI